MSCHPKLIIEIMFEMPFHPKRIISEALQDQRLGG